MGQCEDDIKIPFPVVHSILIRRECISCIFWLVERQIRDKKLQLKCGWCVKTTSWITPYHLYSRMPLVPCVSSPDNDVTLPTAASVVMKLRKGCSRSHPTASFIALHLNITIPISVSADYHMWVMDMDIEALCCSIFWAKQRFLWHSSLMK